MAKKLQFDRYFFLGLFVLASLIANQWVNFTRWHDPLEILWFCDLTALLLGTGLIFKNRMLITTTLVTAVPAQAVWIVDFFLEIFGHGMGRTAQLWLYGKLYGQAVFWLSVNLHAILIPISLYAVWKLGFSKKTLWLVIVYVALLLSSSFFFTPPVENRNCVFFDCDGQDPGGGYLRYFLANSLLFWIMIMTASFYLMRFLFRAKLYPDEPGKDAREITSETAIQ